MNTILSDNNSTPFLVEQISRYEAAPRRCSVVVVGGGLAGLELIKELAHWGVTDVLLVEAGPAEDMRHANWAYPPDVALKLWLAPETDKYFRQPWRSLRPPSYTESSGIRQRLGGRSLYWYGVSLPIEPTALTEPWWPKSVVTDLRHSWRDGPALYTRVLRQLATWKTEGESELADPEMTWRLGELELRRTPRAIRHNADLTRWRAYSPLDCFKENDGNRGGGSPIPLLTSTQALSIRFSGRNACGVSVRDSVTEEIYDIDADHVVLAAGTIENTRLAAQALFETGAIEAPRLNGLSDHLVQGIFVRLPKDSGSRLIASIGNGSYFVAGGAHDRSNLFLDIQENETDGTVLVDLQMTGEQLRSDSNYIELGRPYSDRRIEINSSLSPEDQMVLSAQRSVLQETWDHLAQLVGLVAVRLEFGDFSAPKRTNSLVFPESIRQIALGVPTTWSGVLGTEDHEGGTLPFGTVLNDQQEFNAVSCLYVVGPAAFPRMGSANPSLTTLALAHRLAAILADRA